MDTNALMQQLVKQNEMMAKLLEEMSGSKPAERQDFTADRELLRKSMDDGLFEKMEAYFKAQNSDMLASIKEEVDALKKENSSLKEQFGTTTNQLRSSVVSLDADEEFDKMPVSEGLPFTWGQVRGTAVESMDKTAADKYSKALADWKAKKSGEPTPASSSARGGSQTPAGGKPSSPEVTVLRDQAMLDVANGKISREEFYKQYGGAAAA